jgi:hypothetical protein
MQNPIRFFSAFRSTAAITLFAAAATLGAHAQQGAAEAAAQPLFPVQLPAQPVAIQVPTLLAMNDTTDVNSSSSSSSSLNYSSSTGAADAAAAENFISPAAPAGDETQPPPRRYGRRPVYADSSHNADGSNKYSFFGGVGFTLPTGGTHNDLATSYSFQFGGGRNFNKHFGVMLQFDWDNFGFTSQTLNDQINLYNNAFGAGFATLGGHSHIWSFTVDPVYNFWQGDKMGTYVVGGVGFYHKVANFTTPETEEIDEFGFPEEFEANQSIDDYTSNAVGFNGGIGFTYKPSHFGGERFYAEARYVYIDNSPRAGYTNFDFVNGLNTTYTGSNFFPQNSAKTTYIPIKFGVRF